MITFESRASVVLYKYLVSNNIARAFLLPANICPIVPITFLKARVPFEFVDIDQKTLCIDEETVRDKISNNPKKYGGVLFNHTYGVAHSPKRFYTGLKILDPIFRIIDDRCLCKPGFEESIEELSVIDLILYSTGCSKYADIGLGGIGVMKDDYYQESNFSDDYNHQDYLGLEKEYKHSIKTRTFFNYIDTNWLDCRIPPINYNDYFQQVNTAITKVVKQKHILNSIYSANLDRKIQYPSEFQNWRFNIRVPNKDILLEKIFCGKLFASSLYESLGEGIFSEGHFPVASKVNSETINLFNDFNFDGKKAISVCRIINQHLSNYN